MILSFYNLVNQVVFVFFFSSRRRHTRWTGDWSSDVCFSDLALPQFGAAACELGRALEVAGTLLRQRPRDERAAVAGRVVGGAEPVADMREERPCTLALAAVRERERQIRLGHADRSPVPAAPAELACLLEPRDRGLGLAEAPRPVSETGQRERLAGVVGEGAEAVERVLERRPCCVTPAIAPLERR